MSRSNAIKKLAKEFPKNTEKENELERLSEFLDAMKAAGVAKRPRYGLPQPDTIGKILVSVGEPREIKIKDDPTGQDPKPPK